MKLLTTLFILFCVKGMYSQPDHQWLIYDELGKDGMIGTHQNTYSNSLGDIIKFNSVRRPPPESQINGDTRIYANQFFFISNDGSFTLSQYDNSNHNNKFNNTSSKIKYAYLTNIYQQDDPPNRVTVTNASNGVAPALDPSNNIYPTGNLATNHDILHNKDITLIVKDLPSNSGIYTLCYSGIYQEEISFNESNLGSTNALHMQGTFITNSPDPINFLDDPNSQLDNCLQFEYTTGNVFLNFNIELRRPIIVDTDIIFKLYQGNIPKPGTMVGDSLNVLVNSKFHDPNFIELMCIWQEETNNKVVNKARYKISCYNEDEYGDVDFVSFILGLPKVANHENPNVDLLNWNIGGKKGCGQKGSNLSLSNNLPTLNITNGLLEIRFPQNYGLGVYNNKPKESYTAVFEMIVELDPNLTLNELHFANLYFYNPRTKFENTTYPIKEFISHDTCLTNADITLPDSGFEGCIWVNKVDGPCGKICGPVKPPSSTPVPGPVKKDQIKKKNR